MPGCDICRYPLPMMKKAVKYKGNRENGRVAVADGHPLPGAQEQMG